MPHRSGPASHGLDWLGIRLDADANNLGRPRLHAPASAVTIWIVRAEEERLIAQDALSLMAGGS